MQTTEERMAMIRAAAKKFQKKQNRAARFTRQERVSKKSAKKKKHDECEIYWTDSVDPSPPSASLISKDGWRHPPPEGEPN